MELLNFLKENSAVLTVVFAGAVTVATIVYAILTWKLVSETQLMRRVQTDPRIEITINSLDIAIHLVRLRIRNIGQGPAIGLRFSPRVINGAESAQALLDEFTDINYFKTGISYFGPGEERFSSYTEMVKDHDGKIASVIAFDLKYKGASGSEHNESIVIDMAEYKGTYRLGKPHLYSIAESLEKLQKDVRHITSGFKRIRADVYSQADRDLERQEALKQREEFRKRQDDV
ncbi:hypothetical protein VDG39_17785 [Xanthomonas campestris pv. raphani]|uniref:hypothetical protein n=1 Tax=Xanthomonas campestris TaxID=339 RepID=UPI002B2226FC|nr:hypothetical protein [Xanthomonas campestris]MEA9914536.1 hypothetical protein [Xanthomonas campestris pv. raphani]